MPNTIDKKQKRSRSRARIRAKVFGTPARPRLSVFKSNRYLFAQVIDDTAGKTLLSVSTRKSTSGTFKDKARKAGEELATRAKGQGIEKVVFDRGGFIYTGRIKAFADAARGAGLTF